MMQLRVPLALGVLLGVLSCTTARSPRPPPAKPASALSGTAAVAAPVEHAKPGARASEAFPPARQVDPAIMPGHVLSIAVLVGGQEEVHEHNARVSSGGDVFLPMVGVVHVAGLTPRELTGRLQAAYTRFLKSPAVDVNFVIDTAPAAVSPWGSVTVLGAVNHPGRMNIPPTQDLTLSMSVQLAGGLAPSAKDTSIRVSRRRPHSGICTTNINLRAVASDSLVENDILLQDGDILFVPETVF
jgi:polysaccharide export outer membrane protein